MLHADDWDADDWEELEPTPDDLLASAQSDDRCDALWDALDDEAPEPEAGDFWLPDDESYD